MKIFKEKDPCCNMSPRMSYAFSVVNNQLNFNPSEAFTQAFSEAECLSALQFYEENAHEPVVQRLCADLEIGLPLIILAQRRQFRAL